ncbi:hypothetical protein ONE63_008183 [Megalurothrips usitatus]|uniref:Uncharacterized protein n=1 Tax=Megalurothrips usitatus TaxID=439358 RepID=A0AAV7XS82_9NEOP|nr:hypothetical protein ONE63_008183 [Megalurothrips usitatus]
MQGSAPSLPERGIPSPTGGALREEPVPAVPDGNSDKKDMILRYAPSILQTIRDDGSRFVDKHSESAVRCFETVLCFLKNQCFFKLPFVPSHNLVCLFFYCGLVFTCCAFEVIVLWSECK